MRIALMFIMSFFQLPWYLFKVFSLSSEKSRASKEKKYKWISNKSPKVCKRGRVKVVCEGIEKVPDEGGLLFTPNHQGMFDVLCLLNTQKRPFSTVAKIETQKVFLLKNVLVMLDSLFMDRSDVKQSMEIIFKAADRLEKGDNFVIFPEGTRSRKGNEIGRFKAGTYKAAYKAKATVVPVALIDCFLPFDVKSIKKVEVKICYLEPIRYEEYKDLKTSELSDLVSTRIREKIEEEVAKKDIEKE